MLAASAMSQQVDPAAAVHMAQQEMEYRVDLFNKCDIIHNGRVYVMNLQGRVVLMTLCTNAGWCLHVMTSALIRGMQGSFPNLVYLPTIF